MVTKRLYLGAFFDSSHKLSWSCLFVFRFWETGSSEGR